MDFGERIRELASRIPAQKEHIRTEEACKNALVMPFINALGYNVFDPREVTPELVADVGVKKGEKVDYAILKDGKPIILFECKGCDCNLDSAHASQLYRYFSVTDARFSILTNGIVYRFYSDLESPNRMDAKPFLEVNMLALDDGVVAELAKFAKTAFNVETILATASELKYTKEIKRIMMSELQQPSEEMVRIFLSRVYGGRATASVREQFGGLVKRALNEFVSDRVRERLINALESEKPAQPSASPLQEGEAALAEEERSVTTEEEILGWNIVRAILAEVVDLKRITIRDQQSYCAILFDNNNRRPICRLHFNSPKRKHLGVFDENRVETRFLLEEISHIYRYAGQLKATASRYLGAPPLPGEGQPGQQEQEEGEAS